MQTYEVAKDLTSGDWLCLHRNENLFIRHHWARELLIEKMEDDALFSAYPDATCWALRAELADHFGVEPANVYVGNGSDGVLADLLSVLRGRFDDLAMLDVGFRVYRLLAKRFGFRTELIPGNTFLTGRVQPLPQPALYAVDSPNSVTGVQLDRADLAGLAEDRLSFLIYDNVHGDFTGERPPRVRPNVAFIRSFSKYYGLAGARVGYCIAHADLVAEMLAIKDIYNVSSFAQTLALEALRQKELFDDAAAQILTARDRLVDLLERLDFQVKEPAAHFVFATHRHHSAARIQEALERRRIAIRRFTEAPLDNWLRITVPQLDSLKMFQSVLTSVLERLAT